MGVSHPGPVSYHRAIQNGNSLVATLPKKTVKRVPGRGYKLFSWLPESFAVFEESGQSVDSDSIDTKWGWYFDGNEFEWNLIFPTQETAVNSESDVVFGVRPIVQNIYGQGVAVEINFGKTSVHSWPGSIYLIPLLPGSIYPDALL